MVGFTYFKAEVKKESSSGKSIIHLPITYTISVDKSCMPKNMSTTNSSGIY